MFFFRATSGFIWARSQQAEQNSIQSWPIASKVRTGIAWTRSSSYLKTSLKRVSSSSAASVLAGVLLDLGPRGHDDLLSSGGERSQFAGPAGVENFWGVNRRP